MTAPRKPILLGAWLRSGQSVNRPIIKANSFDSFLITVRDNAPYLDDLCHRWPDVLTGFEVHTPENILANILENVVLDNLEPLRATLRQAKQKIHLITALCDLAGYWDWEVVTSYLSDFADKVMGVLIEAVAVDMDFEAGPNGPVQGLFVLALGKYGGRELNYSSDIDLIVFYDPDLIKLSRPERAERTLIKFVRTLMRGFDEVTGDGYVFRTDLRLRPDPRSNSVAVSTLTAERYYESLGQNWERSAMIKARYCGGDKIAADVFMKNILAPFIWRTSMDFAAVSDIHSIKRQSQTRSGEIDFLAPGHNIKLGIGGIREIEIFTNVQQLILGGRNKALRTPRTIDALQVLAGGKYIDDATARTYRKSYGFLRDIEHRLQMSRDEQTHKWPTDLTRRDQISRLCGAKDAQGFEPMLSKVLSDTHDIYGALFAGEEDLSTAKGSLMFTGVEPEETSLATLDAYGFKRGGEVWQLMADWLGGRIRATRSERARELLTRLAPRIIENCAATGSPDTAFFSFAEFITGLNAGVTLFSLFVNKPKALETLIKMLTLAPPLVDILSHSPNLIDPMVEPDFLSRSFSNTIQTYTNLSGGNLDFEIALNHVRRGVHEDQLSLIARMLNLQNIDSAGLSFSNFAAASIEGLLPVCAQEIGRRYSKLTGEYAIIALGKLGGREMRYTSDVDIMLVYEPHPNEDEGLYNKLTRRLITALSSITQEGRLYEVDMALRPSGRSGPLAVPLSGLEAYYQKSAWVWEFMALSKARVIAASSLKFSDHISKVIVKILAQKDYDGGLETGVLDMRKRLQKDKPAKSIWDIKSVGGGLRDIEFIAQYLMLKYKPEQVPHASIDMLICAHEHNWISDNNFTDLSSALQFYERFGQMNAITTQGILKPQRTSISVKQVLAQSVELLSFEALSSEYDMHRLQTSSLFSEIL